MDGINPGIIPDSTKISAGSGDMSIAEAAALSAAAVDSNAAAPESFPASSYGPAVSYELTGRTPITSDVPSAIAKEPAVVTRFVEQRFTGMTGESVQASSPGEPSLSAPAVTQTTQQTPDASPDTAPAASQGTASAESQHRSAAAARDMAQTASQSGAPAAAHDQSPAAARDMAQTAPQNEAPAAAHDQSAAPARDMAQTAPQSGAPAAAHDQSPAAAKPSLSALSNIIEIAGSALSAAGQPVSDESIALVRAMCSGNMPIDSTSLNDVLLGSFAISDSLFALMDSLDEALASPDFPEELRSPLATLAFDTLGTDESPTSSVSSGIVPRGTLTALLKNRFSLSVADASPESVRKLYSDMARFASEVARITASQDKTHDSHRAELHRSARHTSHTLSSLTDPGRIFPYVEIPLRFASEHGSASVFVRRDRGHKLQSGEDRSLLLRLDMPHLGGVDISVRLHGRHLALSFFSEPEPIRLLRDDIESLTAKLGEHGFTVTKEFTENSTQSDIARRLPEDKARKLPEDISHRLPEDSLGSASHAGHRNFDVRA